MEIRQIGIDTSKHVFTLHGVDASGAAVVRRDLKRSAFEAYMAKLAPTEVALEACGGAPLGTAANGDGPPGAADPASIRQALR
jgi:hypothetical protein